MPNLRELTIRKATGEDKPRIIELIIEFYKESLRDFGIKFDLETLYETVQNFIDNQIGIVAEEEGKFEEAIGLYISANHYGEAASLEEKMGNSDKAIELYKKY